MARNKYDVDESLETQFDISQLKRLFHYIKPYRKKMIFVVIIMLTASALSMINPKLMMIVMDKYIPDENIKGIVQMSLIFMVVVLVIVVTLRIKIKCMAQIGQNIIHQIRKDLFVHLQELPFSYYDERPHGKIQVRVVNYVNNLSDLLSNGIINTITDLFSLIFIIIFMMTINVKLTLICLCGLPVMVGFLVIIKKKQRRAWQRLSNKSSNLNAYIAESMNGIRVTQSFVREETNTDIFNKLSDNYRTAWLDAVHYNFMLSPLVDNISVITTAVVYVLGISWLIGGVNAVTIGTLVAFSSYISRFWSPITNIASFYNSLLTAISYLERIFETIDEPVDVKDAPGAEDMPEIHGDVEFKNVYFSYEEGNPILKDVSFKVKQGESYAIVGPTGAGKTTIINLLSRFYNLDSGQILIDGIDINTVTIKSLRSQMGVMLQDSFIFSGTIMDNIRYGNMTATDEEVVEAAKTVCAHDFIMQMENGYYTEVNERGNRLSAGQRQLISFARALLANPKILILDEATSSIDTETEIALQKGLNRLLKNRTSFIIAHRLSTIKNATCIMYVDKGEIVEKGDHETLMRYGGEYRELYLSQYRFLLNQEGA